MDHDGRWIPTVSSVVELNRSNPGNLVLILDLVSGSGSPKFRTETSEIVFRILKSFHDCDPQRDLNLASEQKLFSACLGFFEQNVSTFFGQNRPGVEPTDFWSVLVGLAKQSDLAIVLR